MAITFSGLATGLDTDSIVKDIMELERAPIDRIKIKKEQETLELKAYAQFRDKLNNLKSIVGDMNLTSQIRTTSVFLSSQDAFTAESDGGAVGSYNISVSQLSQIQKTVTDGFSSRHDSVLGTGTITVNGETINVDDANNSLSGLVAAINEISDTTGVEASIINDGSSANPFHLVFSGVDSSTSFSISSNLVNGQADPVQLNPVNSQEAQQAKAYIDGIEIVSDSNTISGTIPGVKIHLNSVSETLENGELKTDRLDIVTDTDALKEKVTSFVTAYNDVMEWILSGYDEFGTVTTDEGEDEMLGSVLRGDATINNVKRQLQGILSSVIDNDGDFTILGEIGITTNLNGTLNQDNSRLNKALENNFDDVVALLSGDDKAGGVMKKFNSLLLDITSISIGMYANQKNAYDTAINKYDDQISILESRMVKREATLRNQFTIMEQLVSSLNAQGAFLTQQMEALKGDN